MFAYHSLPPSDLFFKGFPLLLCCQAAARGSPGAVGPAAAALSPTAELVPPAKPCPR